MEEESLDELREEVKKVTIEIIRLAGKRMTLVGKIGEIKRQKKLPIENLKVEARLRQVVAETCKKYNIDIDFGFEILNFLIHEAKRAEKRVGVQGHLPT